MTDLLRQRGLTVRAFASQVGCSHPFVSRIMRGERFLKDEDAVQWATVLGLRGDAREHFLDLAALVQTPQRIRERLARYET